MISRFKKAHFHRWAFLFSVVLFGTKTGQAHMAESYGLGSRSAALSGATVSWGADGFAAYQNPAALGIAKEKKFIFSAGLTYNAVNFEPIDNVIVDSDYVSDQSGPVRGNVDVTDYRPTFGAVLGGSFRVAPHMMNVSAGFSVFLPLEQLTYMDSGHTFVPEYVLYRSRTQRPEVSMAGSFEPIKNVSFGAGLQSAFNLISNGDIFVQGQSTGSKPSSMRFSASLKPTFVPYFGILFVSSKNTKDGPKEIGSARGAFSVGAVFRMEGKSENEMKLRTGARVLAPLAAVPFQFNTDSVMFYDPKTVEFGASYQYLDKARLYAQVDYQVWSDFEAPGINLTPSGNSVNVAAGGVPAFYTRDIFVPRVGHEYKFNSLTIRFGYSYRPGIFKDAPNGPGNYLDPDRDIVTAGLGIPLDQWISPEMPFVLDLHGIYQSLRAQHISKTAGDENGAGTGDQKIGAPGYTADGYVWGVGASVTTSF